MSKVRLLVFALALLESGWMLFDGARALIVGDYVTPASGPYAGRLGPWSLVVKAIGVNPQSTAMKSVFAVYGLVWMLIAFAFLANRPWSRPAMLAAAAGTLWYLPLGTVFSLIQIVLLI